jgi:molybdopterin converting factor small subunit
MKLQVMLFARAREIVGRPTLELEGGPGTDIGQLRGKMLAACPDLAELLPHCHFSVDQRFVDDAMTVAEDSEIACIPPVSGG